MRILLLRIVFAAYLVAVGFAVWAPNPADGAYAGVLAMPARWLASLGLPFEPSYAVLEFTANIAMFVPFGVLAMTAFRMRVWSTTLAGLATSALIEGVQLFLPTRYSTVSDLVANTAGALVGALLVAAVRRSRTRRSQQLPSVA
ncbi:VanZ family protein [Protaetiibacter intestinalis]|uniref:VanZ family protein n=1 Tax=Protaetiibacter intestinalis TaxID=2419774 RepID=A0A387BCV6_9MICO|nr:VanZ family protein [Protaetiibacter intestinalis]AYF98956.1 VanZ family protein [Protaetiibacter intestinalis]